MDTKVKDHPSAVKALDAAARRILDSLKPPPRLKLSEWCDEYRILSKESNPIGGKWDTDVAPFQRGILDAMNDWSTQDIVICSSAQVGKTSCIENLVAYYIAHDPAPILCIFPEGSTLRAFSQDRIDPMVRDMPILNERMDKKRERDASNTISYKKFRGGHLTFATAGSSKQLRSRPIRILLCDEIDAYDLNLSGEGDPIRLARARTNNFFNRKIVLASTPTLDETSRIYKAFEASNQQFFECPCPECGHYQILSFGERSQYHEDGKTGKLVWELDDPDTTYYECVKGCRIEHHSKHQMLMAGKWVARNPTHKTAGFFINSLYSPWTTWVEIVQEFLEVKNDPFQLQVFINTRLGEVWKESINVQVNDLVNHCDTYDADCPTGVGVITAGVDVQQNRLEVGVWGWGKDNQVWFLDHIQIFKDPGTPEAWKELEHFLQTTTYTNVKGGEIGIHAAAIDTGYQPDLVRSYAKNTKKNRVFMVRGINKYGMNIIASKKPSKNKDGSFTWAVGTDTAKKLLFSMFKKDTPGDTYVYFPLNTAHDLRDLFSQLTSERPVSKVKNGRRVLVFEKKHHTIRNEALDCLVYSMAALRLIGNRVMDKMGHYVQTATDKGPSEAKKKEEKTEDITPSYSQQALTKRMTRIKQGRTDKWKTGW
jgi:phage terminase large subunit GpA-like protein